MSSSSLVNSQHQKATTSQSKSETCWTLVVRTGSKPTELKSEVCLNSKVKKLQNSSPVCSNTLFKFRMSCTLSAERSSTCSKVSLQITLWMKKHKCSTARWPQITTAIFVRTRQETDSTFQKSRLSCTTLELFRYLKIYLFITLFDLGQLWIFQCSL